MTREQIEAWFILEGYRAYNWKGNDKFSAPYTFRRMHDTLGWISRLTEWGRGWETYSVHVDPKEIEYPLSEVPQGELTHTFEYLTRDCSKEAP